MADQSASKKCKCFVSDAETEATLKNIPFAQKGVELDVQIGDVMSAVAYLKENRSPDILFIDITKSKFPTSGLDALADVCEPGVEVIAIGEKNEVGIYRDLIRAGVRDYFVKPLPVQPLMKCVEGIIDKTDDPEHQGFFHKTGKIVAVIGAVGGIGVSTVVSNLGWALTERKQKRVALVDMDFHLGTVADSLDVELTENSTQLFSSPERVDDLLVERHMSQINDNFMLLGAQTPLDKIDDYKTESADSVLNILSSKFHYVVVDVPKNFQTPTAVDVLKRADTVVLLTDYSINGLKAVNKIITMLKSFISIGQQIVLVANKTGAYSQGEIPKGQFEERLPLKIDVEIPFDRKEPMLFLTNGNQVVSEGSGELSKGLIRIMNLVSGGLKSEETKKSGGFFSSMFSR